MSQSPARVAFAEVSGSSDSGRVKVVLNKAKMSTGRSEGQQHQVVDIALRSGIFEEAPTAMGLSFQSTNRVRDDDPELFDDRSDRPRRQADATQGGDDKISEGLKAEGLRV